MSEDADAVAEMVAERPDNVPEKFWDNESNSVRTDAVLESYSQLESRFGAFTGAPDNYEFKLSESLVENGVELDSESELISRFTEMAKEANMSQDMANNLVNMFVENQFASSQVSEEQEDARVAEEMKLLGDNAQQRVDNISRWAEANLDEQTRAGLEEATTTAAGVAAVEKLIAMTRNAPLANDDTTDTEMVSDKELQEMQFKRDENGNRLMQTDPEYRKKVEDLYKRKYGDSEHRILIG